MFCCKNCKKIFTTNRRLKYHIENKVCEISICELCNKECKGLKWSTLHKDKCLINLLKTSESEEFEIVKNEKNEKDENMCCVNCDKKFTRKDNLRRHLIKCNKIFEKVNKKNNENLKDIEELKNKINVINNNITNNVTNNVTNIINNYYINIHVSGNYEESLKHINISERQEICTSMYGSIPMFIEKCHFNDKYPMHKIVKYKNRDKYTLFEKNKNNNNMGWHIYKRDVICNYLLNYGTIGVCYLAENGGSDKMTSYKKKIFIRNMENISNFDDEGRKFVKKLLASLIQNGEVNHKTLLI
jgi:hypothetical protein